MRSILVLLILVMIGLNGKGQSVTALPDSVLSQCCLEVTLLNGNVTTVDWVFIQYITRDGTGTKLFVEYAPNFGGIQWETQIRIQDDFDDVIERSKFIILPFTVGSTDYGINRNWIANIEENTTTGGTWIYGRFGTPTKRKFSAVEDYETLKNLLLACRPRAIVVAENGLYTEGDTVRMGGFLIENTSITTEGYNWQMKDTLSSVEFGLDYLTPETLDTTVYWARRHGSLRQMVQLGRRYYYNSIRDTLGGLYSDFTHSWNAGDPFLQYQTFNPLAPTTGTAWFKIQKDNSFLNLSNDGTNPFYSLGWAVTNSTATLGASESGSGDFGNGVVMGAYGFGTTEFLFMKTKAVDAGTATNGQFLQLIDNSSGEVDFATIDPVDSSLYATRYWTTANFFPLEGGTLTGTGGAGFIGLPSQVTAPSTPSSGLNIYAQGSSFNFKGTDGYERQFGGTITGGRSYTLPDVNGTLALGTGTADRLARWIATNTLAAGNLSDNGTRLAALLPWQFQTYTTAGLPTGVTGYHVYNTTTNGPAWYQGLRWAYGLESTANRFTTGSLIFADANGQVAENNSQIFWDNLNTRLIIGAASMTNAKKLNVIGGITAASSNTGATNGRFVTFDPTNDPPYLEVGKTGVFFSRLSAAGSGRFDFENWTSGSAVQIARFNNGTLNINKVLSGQTVAGLQYSKLTLTGNLYPVSTSNPSISLTVYTAGGSTDTHEKLNVYGGETGRIDLNPNGGNVTVNLSTNTSTENFDVNGDGRFRDSLRVGSIPNQTSATKILSADASGWIGYRAFSDFASTNIYTANGSLTADRTLHGSGYTLRFNANTIVRDSFKVANLSDHATPDSIVTTKGGWLGKKKFLMDGTNSYSTGYSGFYNESYYGGFQSAGNNTYNVLYQDTTGYSELGSYRGSIKAGLITSDVNTANPTTYFLSQNGLYGMGVQAKTDFVRFFLDGGANIRGNSTVLNMDSLGTLSLNRYGGTTKTDVALSKTFSTLAGFATDGTVLNVERKRDTTIYINDADYDFSTALTTAQISRRYNRIIFLMTTTAAAGSNSELTLHTPDANLMQCEYLIRSTDEAGGFTNVIQFGSNNAVQSDNTLTGSYIPAPGQGVGIRAGLRSGTYKYYYY